MNNNYNHINNNVANVINDIMNDKFASTLSLRRKALEVASSKFLLTFCILMTNKYSYHMLKVWVNVQTSLMGNLPIIGVMCKHAKDNNPALREKCKTLLKADTDEAKVQAVLDLVKHLDTRHDDLEKVIEEDTKKTMTGIVDRMEILGVGLIKAANQLRRKVK